MNVSSTKKHLNEGSRSITYHSRMRYLKSREGRTSGDLLGKRHSGVESLLTSFPFTKNPNSCSTERLLPPVQLMTKEKSLRHIYRLRHPPDKVAQLDFFHKKKKTIREDVRARIHAEQLALLHLNDGKDTCNNTEKGEKITPDGIIEQKCEKGQDQTNVEENQRITRCLQSNPKVDSDKHERGVLSEQAKVNDDKKEIYDDIHIGTTFAFLKEWRKESDGCNASRFTKLRKYH